MKRIMVVICLLILSGCQALSEEALQYQENYEIIGNEKEKMLENTSHVIYKSIDRENSKAKEITIDAIYKEGKNVIPTEGRYQITGQLTGNVYIYDEEDNLLFHDLIAPNPLGVESITIDLDGTNILHVDGFDQVNVMPVSTQLLKELTPGIWEVGKDIQAGNYSVTGEGFGYLEVFEQGKVPRIYEVIGGESQTKTELSLQDGQKLRITKLVKVKFESN